MKVLSYILWGIIIFNYIMVFFIPPIAFVLYFSCFLRILYPGDMRKNTFSVYPWDENRITDSVWDGLKACMAEGSFLFHRKRIRSICSILPTEKGSV